MHLLVSLAFADQQTELWQQNELKPTLIIGCYFHFWHTFLLLLFLLLHLQLVFTHLRCPRRTAPRTFLRRLAICKMIFTVAAAREVFLKVVDAAAASVSFGAVQPPLLCA